MKTLLAVGLFMTSCGWVARNNETTPTTTQNYVQVSSLGNTSDGSIGRLTIQDYSARLFQGSDQSIVDAQDSAAYIPWQDKVMIADHASQGFSVIRTLSQGAQATIIDNSEIVNLSMVSTYQGTNTGNGIDLADGRYAETVDDGSYILYTCNDAEGISVTVTYWTVTSTQPVVVATPTPEPVVQTPTAPSSSSQIMYRLYNPNSGEHFYTSSTEERDFLDRIGWNYEGPAWNAVTNGQPVYRLYNPYSGGHHYTMSVEERDFLDRIGWNYEGIGWYSDPNQAVPVYRLYNPYSGDHHYTTSWDETTWLDSLGWNYEGIAWYGAN